MFNHHLNLYPSQWLYYCVLLSAIAFSFFINFCRLCDGRIPELSNLCAIATLIN